MSQLADSSGSFYDLEDGALPWGLLRFLPVDIFVVLDIGTGFVVQPQSGVGVNWDLSALSPVSGRN